MAVHTGLVDDANLSVTTEVVGNDISFFIGAIAILIVLISVVFGLVAEIKDREKLKKRSLGGLVIGILGIAVAVGINMITYFASEV